MKKGLPRWQTPACRLELSAALGRPEPEESLREAREFFASMSYKPALAETKALLGESEAAAVSVASAGAGDEARMRDSAHERSALPRPATRRGHRTDTSETTRATSRDASGAS
jgi:hypothetical protein